MTHTAPGYWDDRADTSPADGHEVQRAGTSGSESTPAARRRSETPTQTSGVTTVSTDHGGDVAHAYATHLEASDTDSRTDSQARVDAANGPDASAEQHDPPPTTWPPGDADPHDGSMPPAQPTANSHRTDPNEGAPTAQAGSHRAHPHGGSAPAPEPAACPHTPDPDRQGWTVPHRQGRPVHLVVTMTLASLMGIRDDPAILTGHGEMTAEWGRCMSRAARSLSVLVTDDRGRPLDVSARVYRPRQSIRDRVLTMTPTCVFPGCNTAAYRCDLDHQIPFDHADPTRGGPTSADNVDPLCRSHHRLKTHGGWRYWTDAQGARTFRSPLGVRITTPAPDITPVPPRSSPIEEPPPF